jgi:hypothetical protein
MSPFLVYVQEDIKLDIVHTWDLTATTKWVCTCCAHGERLNDHDNKVEEAEEEED